MGKIIYIAGKISGDKNYQKKFADKEYELIQKGYKVLNPTIIPDFLDYEKIMNICFAMIEVCDCVYLMKDWKDSKGAIREESYGRMNNKEIIYEKG